MPSLASRRRAPKIVRSMSPTALMSFFHNVIFRYKIQKADRDSCRPIIAIADPLSSPVSPQQQLGFRFSVEALDVPRRQRECFVAVLAAAAVVLEGQIGHRPVRQQRHFHGDEFGGSVPKADVSEAFCVRLRKGCESKGGVGGWQGRVSSDAFPFVSSTRAFRWECSSVNLGTPPKKMSCACDGDHTLYRRRRWRVLSKSESIVDTTPATQQPSTSASNRLTCCACRKYMAFFLPLLKRSLPSCLKCSPRDSGVSSSYVRSWKAFTTPGSMSCS